MQKIVRKTKMNSLFHWNYANKNLPMPANINDGGQMHSYCRFLTSNAKRVAFIKVNICWKILSMQQTIPKKKNI